MGSIVIGSVLGLLLLMAIIASLRSHSPTSPGPTASATTPATPTVPPSPLAAVGPVGNDAVPGVGGDVFIAGGVTRVLVPTGWTLLARGNRPDEPGGYPASAVLARPESGVTLAVYLLSGTTNPADATTGADAAARNWTRDGKVGSFEPALQVAPFGAVVGAASMRYLYARGSDLEGEAFVAIRQTGLTLVVFVDAHKSALETTRGLWQPLRDAVLNDFAGLTTP